MSGFEWLPEFAARLDCGHPVLSQDQALELGPGRLYTVDRDDWRDCIEAAAAQGLRWAGLWADALGDGFACTTCFARGGDYLLLRTRLDGSAPRLASHAHAYPAADRMERHIRDLLGVEFVRAEPPRRWTRHQAWPAGRFPLRPSEPVGGAPPAATPADTEYPFVQVQGAGVSEIPVGPVHAGIIEPGHFRFQAVGEQVLNLEARLGYVHKGIEKVAAGRDPRGLARLAARVSGDSTAAHAWAACMAMEEAAAVAVPARGQHLRAILLERERIANHLGDIGAICNDVGFSFAYYQFTRLREGWLGTHGRVFGHRLLMDRITPGGVGTDMDEHATAAMTAEIGTLRRELSEILPIVDDHPSLDDRLMGTGILTGGAAARLGALGYVGRASGVDLDVRRDRPHAPYDTLTVDVPVLYGGDVAARIKVRSEEITVSLGLLEHLLARLPDGPVTVPCPAPADREGLGVVEGWRGEVLAYVRFGEDAAVARYFPRDPSWFAWPALEELIDGNIVPDFPVCNKSVNGSYSGHDL